MRADLPAGTVTFLFTDVEGSTKLLRELGVERYADALAEHRRAIREAAAAHGGVEVDTQGDAFFIAFPTAPGALRAAAAACDALSDGPIRVRIGLHSGTPLLTDEGYVGSDVHRAARIAGAGHGGQILVSSATAALAGDLELRDLGPHRLKDLSAAERIYQLGRGEFPPLKSLHQTNLPIPATPFLGREKELPEVLRLLLNDEVRLLTLTGPGGTGKTRLAAQAAGLVSERYPDGVWWVPLAPLRDPQLVLTTASQTLGAKNGVADHIADKSMLVLFDNFEQVAEAATDVAHLLARCPRLDVLVTSRERLHVTGEQEYNVPPLAPEEGIGFFLARARAVAPEFEADEHVMEICRRLDELPLALELAAARVKALTTQQILERLDQRLPLLTGGARDLPERQRTLRATIEWSYSLLTPDEQRLFAQVGVFRGGCTLEAAEAVAGASVDVLQSLVDKSLVRHTQNRYSMLETIREFSGELLDDETRQRHAQYFVDVAEAAFPELQADPGDLVGRLELEHDNFRAALDWLEQRGESELALRLTGALGRFWYLRGHPQEGAERLERALARADRQTAVRANALIGSAILLTVVGDRATATDRADEALMVYRQLDDAWGTAKAYLVLGHIAMDAREVERARELFEESASRFDTLPDDHHRLLAKLNLAWALGELGADNERHALLNEVLQASQAMKNKRTMLVTLGELADIASGEGRADEALAMLREAYALSQDVGERPELADMASRMASVLAAHGHPLSAARLLAKSMLLHEETGTGDRFWIAARDRRTLETVQSDLDEATFKRAWADGEALGDDDVAAETVVG